LNKPLPISIAENESKEAQSGGLQINLKRVLDRIIQLWYVILISLGVGVLVAFLINRYSVKKFPVRASIIIRESEENAGAKFLYDNALINPYRNFFNEIYIMKSYPLLQEVIQELGFDVSLYREGELMTTEYYSRDFPVRFSTARGSKPPYGLSMYFTVKDEHSYSLQYVEDDEAAPVKLFEALTFEDTVQVNGFRICAKKRRSDVSDLVGRRYVIRFNNPLVLAKSYSTRLQATWAEPGSSVVNLDITGPIAAKEIDFLNKFIERYQAYDIEKKNKVATMAMKFLDQQLIVTGDSLNHYEDRVEKFKDRNVITGLGQETERLYIRLKEFEDRKFQYRLNESYYGYVSTLMTNNQYEGIFTPGSVGIDDPVIANLITEVISLQAQINVYRSNSSVERASENPALKNTQQRVVSLKNDILKAIDNNRKTEQINIRFIDDQIAVVNEQLARLPRKERELIDLQRNYSLKENLYVFLLQKKTEAGLSKASTTSSIVLVNPPQASAAISPKVTENYVIGSAIGLLLPLIVFVALEVLNTKIQSKEDIEKITSVPFIGAIGHNLSADPLIVFNKPRSAITESFRAIRSNLNYFTASKNHQTFMITSSLPGEGKSFTSLNISAVFALAGKKTLILGADLRRPKLAEELGLLNNVGLSQYLSGMATLDQILQNTSVPNLSLIAGGPMPPNPSELLLKNEMDLLMEQLGRLFDYIIIDTPPLSFVADAFVLSKFADHTIYVIRQNFTPRDALQAVEEFYQSGKLSNISLLFNDLRKSGFGYGYGHSYGYGYGYGYSYYSKSSKTSGSGYYSDM
jgi:capsular exopolysaccharide synthesis family protein